MIYGLVLVVHVILCFLLIAIILVQGGRGGLGEALAGSASQSLFGGSANVFMTKVTAFAGGLFMATCLSLAALSTARGKSVIEQFPEALPGALPGIPGAGPMIPSPAPSSNATPAAPQPVAPPSDQKVPAN